MAEEDKPSLPLFPIQLAKVDIGEIQYSCAGFSDANVVPAETFNLKVTVSAYDSESKSLQVALTFDSKSDPDNSALPYPYSLQITVHGQFFVHEDRLPFPVAEIRKWAEKNGVIILLPFLRESVHTISQKTGFPPMMIPMIEVSAFQVGAPNHARALKLAQPKLETASTARQ
jgi:preprotein translocase subunit SecB